MCTNYTPLTNLESLYLLHVVFSHPIIFPGLLYSVEPDETTLSTQL